MPEPISSSEAPRHDAPRAETADASYSDTLDIVRELRRLEQLRDPLVEMSGQSNRQARRYPVREEAQIYPMSRHRLDDAGLTVYLRDIGRGGVGFLSNSALAPGTDYRIVFHRDSYAVGESAIVIRYSRPVRPGLHLVGAVFSASAGLLTSLGVQPADLEAEYRGELAGNFANQDAA